MELLDTNISYFTEVHAQRLFFRFNVPVSADECENSLYNNNLHSEGRTSEGNDMKHLSWRGLQTYIHVVFSGQLWLLLVALCFVLGTFDNKRSHSECFLYFSSPPSVTIQPLSPPPCYLIGARFTAWRQLIWSHCSRSCSSALPWSSLIPFPLMPDFPLPETHSDLCKC